MTFLGGEGGGGGGAFDDIVSDRLPSEKFLNPAINYLLLSYLQIITLIRIFFSSFNSLLTKKAMVVKTVVSDAMW